MLLVMLGLGLVEPLLLVAFLLSTKALCFGGDLGTESALFQHRTLQDTTRE